MGGNDPPVQPPSPSLSHRDKIYMDTYTCISAFVLFVTYAIVLTRFRLWHTNKLLTKILDQASSPVNMMINQAIGFVVAYQFQNDLYLIWVVILFIAFDNVFSIANYSLIEKPADRRLREQGFLYSCIFTGVFIIIYKGDNNYYRPLLALWSLVIFKFLIRIISFVFAERAFGLENVNLVAEYMKSEHEKTEPSDTIDPKCMKGYKYLVRGEEKIVAKIEAPDYLPEVELTAGIVTLERVWSCKEGLLHPSVDKDGSFKDVCLSFALFKLLRRRMFGYPAAEAPQTKTSQLIFDGLLSPKAKGTDDREVDIERVFRVIKVELGFLRDLIFTRYPVGFAFGFPVPNLLVLGGTFGVTLWIAIKAFKEHKTNPANYYLSVHSHNVDYPITNSLLILIMVMELSEMLMYVFCDWMKVMMVCQNVKCNSSHVTNHWASSDDNLHDASCWRFGYKVLAYVSKPRFSLSIHNTLGQFSLVKSCNKSCPRSVYPWYSMISTCAMSKTKVRPPGVKKRKSVPVVPEIKRAIFNALVKCQNDLKNGTASLQRNGVRVYEDLQWPHEFVTPVHTIMVWHIATSFCAIHPLKVEGNKESIKSSKKVAISLSNYCAYLVAFHPDLLPLNSNLVKYIFWKIVEETSNFFGREHKLAKKYEKMMNCRDGDQKIIHRGSQLGQYLINNIPDDIKRWKIMADFWSELILSLAPSGSTRAHLEQLGNGSEFITHLWALLYHAGIIDTTNAEYHP